MRAGTKEGECSTLTGHQSLGVHAVQQELHFDSFLFFYKRKPNFTKSHAYINRYRESVAASNGNKFSLGTKPQQVIQPQNAICKHTNINDINTSEGGRGKNWRRKRKGY